MSTIAFSPGFTRSRAAARRPARPTVVRLTRRGRLAATLLFLGLMLCALTVFGSRSAATSHPGTLVSTQQVEVGAGDTLWDIASRTAAPGEVRERMHQIQELNALTSSGLTVGQEIAVPTN